MKNKNTVDGQSFAIEKTGGKIPAAGAASQDLAPSPRPSPPRRGRGWFADAALARAVLWAQTSVAAFTLALALTGCVSTPHTTIQGMLNGSPFVIKAPKDGDLTGFDLTADTNGVVRVHIDHLAVKMNPDVIGQTGAAQTAIIQATGEVASGITAAAVAAAVKTK